MLYFTSGYSAPETVDATKRAEALAEKSDNLSQLVHWATSRGQSALFSGDLAAAATLADQALEFALRDRRLAKPAYHIGSMHLLQLMTRYFRGDLAGAEKHFAAGLKFFDDPGFQVMSVVGVAAFANASWNAWMLGRADVAGEREVKMMAAANQNNPYYVAASANCAANLRLYLREYERAEALAARVLELSEQHKFPFRVATSRCALGHARAHLGRASEGIILIRQGIAGLLEIGTRLGISGDITSLAAAQERAGAIDDALVTVEQALQTNPDELFYRPETLRLRGELRRKRGDTDLAEADFRESIALAQKMGAKAWELRATMSLAQLLDKQGRRDEARTMLADIYNWFTEGFDTADLKDAKALLDELNN
jgi:tetratricopeptide (TPR) repeat protein